MNARRVAVCSSSLRKQGSSDVVSALARHPCESRDPVTFPSSSSPRRRGSSDFASLRSAGLPPAAGNFLCWHKESHQRNAFSKLRAQPVDVVAREFSDSPSWLGRKTAHIHVRRPPGQWVCVAPTGFRSKGRN